MKPIRVEDKLPVHEQEVLAFYPKNKGGDSKWVKARYERHDKRMKGYFDTVEFEDMPEVLKPVYHITHWLPMPPAPKGY